MWCALIGMRHSRSSLRAASLTCERVVVQASVSLMACSLKMPLPGHGGVLKGLVAKLAVVTPGHDEVEGQDEWAYIRAWCNFAIVGVA